VFNLGPTELIIILVILLLLFGGAKLPELARGLGQGIRNFKDASREEPTPPDSSSNKSE
jgi:sec-independent protein translocase protein TatA